MNNLDLMVLRALARLSRMRKGVDCEELALRAGGSIEDVRGALGRLAREQLVDRSANASYVRLTFAGLAVAVASASSAPRAKPARVAVARRRAA